MAVRQSRRNPDPASDGTSAAAGTSASSGAEGRPGAADGATAAFRGVSERRPADEKAFRSEEMLQLVLDTIPQCANWKDLDSVFVGCNAPFARDAGLDDPSQIAGLTDYDMPWGDLVARYRADDREVMESGIPRINYEELHPRPDGSVGWARVSKLPLRAEDGNVIGVLCIYEDVTDKTLAEVALRESEERYRHIIETVTDYVFTVAVENGQAASTLHGAGSVAVTGFSPSELSGDPSLWIEMVVPEDRPLVLEQSRRVLAGGPVEPVEHRIVRKDGAVRWVRNTLVPHVDPLGILVNYDGLIQDITERRALQEQLLQAQKMEGIGRLAGGVAHDFNNLLTAILGYLEMARLDLPADVPEDHPIRADLDEIRSAGERAAGLTRQLLAFASKQIVAPIRLDLSVQVSDSLKMLRPLLGEDIVVDADLEAETGSVEADPGQIQQLLVNLTVNARDAMPHGGRLTIETSSEYVTEAAAAANPGARTGNHVRLSVTDTGTGIAEEVRAHLFEPFFTTKERGKGTGLGLATCHGIVRQMGGHIRVYSEPGVGTAFRIFLPSVDGPADVRSPAAPASPTPTGHETALVVEDEEVVRRLAVLGLRAQGYTVIEAADGAEGLEIARRVAYDLDIVVSDVVMPGMSGPELVKQLAALAPHVRRLLVSGHAESTVLPTDLGEIGAHFLSKPFTPERLARKVREVLDSPEG